MPRQAAKRYSKVHVGYMPKNRVISTTPIIEQSFETDPYVSEWFCDYPPETSKNWRVRMGSLAETRERLVKEDAHFRRLVEQHEEFDHRLAELQSRRWLSAEGQVEEVKLKKMKLAIKDEMEMILRRAAS